MYRRFGEGGWSVGEGVCRGGILHVEGWKERGRKSGRRGGGRGQLRTNAPTGREDRKLDRVRLAGGIGSLFFFSG